MTRDEYLKKVRDTTPKDEVIVSIKAKYGENVPVLVYSILSVSPTPELFDENESRTLSLKEVLNAEKVFGISFDDGDIIPVVELGGDDYIAFSRSLSKWCIYNIVDEMVFDESNDFDTLFLM